MDKREVIAANELADLRAKLAETERERDAAKAALAEANATDNRAPIIRQLTSAMETIRAQSATLAKAREALQTIATTEPWQRCPSTHCERSQECRSPSECSGTGRGIAKRALAAIDAFKSPQPLPFAPDFVVSE